MKDKVEQDVVDISVEEYDTIVGLFKKVGIKSGQIIQTTHIPLPRFNLHIGKKYSFCYQFGESFDENHEKVGHALIILDNAKDNWGCIFSVQTKYINVFKHTLGEHRNNPEAIKKAERERRLAIHAFFVIQHYLKRLPEVWVKNQTSRQLTDKEIKEKKKNGAKRVRKVKLINHYTFSVEELERRAKNKERIKVYLCPCWGVRGHYRHLKSGKTIWVSSYRKGSRRNEENLYETKTYCA